jgi:glycerate kinase
MRDLTGFDACLDGALACFIGESRIDAQSLQGKTICRSRPDGTCAGLSVVAFAGAVAERARSLLRETSAILPIERARRPVAEALAATADGLVWASEAGTRLIHTRFP